MCSQRTRAPSRPGHGVTGLYPPSNWATATREDNGLVPPVVRARHPPDVEVTLEHVYGYNGTSAYQIIQGMQMIDPIQVATRRLLQPRTSHGPSELRSDPCFLCRIASD